MTRLATQSSVHSADLLGMQRLFSDLDELAAKSPEGNAFLDGALVLLARSAKARAGIVWQSDENDGMICADTFRVGPDTITDTSEFTRDILLNADKAFHSGLPDVVLPTEAHDFEHPESDCDSDLAHGNRNGRPISNDAGTELTAQDLVLNCRQLQLPIQQNDHVVRVYSLFQSGGLEVDPRWGNADLIAVQQRIERLLDRMGTAVNHDSAASDCESEQLAQHQQLTELAKIVGSKLDRTDVAYDIVNELHRYFGEGRISFAYVRGQVCKIAAVSNQQVFDRRSAAIMAMTQLGSKVAATQRPIWHPEDADRLPPKINRLFERYYEAADSLSIALLPVIARPEPSTDPNNLSAVVRDRDGERGKVVGVVMIEGMQRSISRDDLQNKWQDVEKIIVNANANANRYASLFLLPVWKFLGSIADLFRGHHRNKAIAATLLVVCIGMALMLIQTDLKLRSNGVIQPVDRSRVYAEAEGVVEELLVDVGEWVEAGQTLARLNNPQLDSEIARVEGQLREAEGKLRTMKLERILGQFPDDEKRHENVRQTAGLMASVEKLQEEYSLLLEKREQLTIHSPVSGQIITWDLPRRLGGRPVQPGQHLLTVADAEGPWELEIKMPDKRSGHLLAAWDESDVAEPLKVTYVLASEPSKVHAGVVRHISRSAEVDAMEGNIVRVSVSLDEPPNATGGKTRSGTEVIAHVHAGEASLGYCKLYEVVAWINRLSFKFL